MRAAYKSQVFAADTAANELATDIAPGPTIVYQWGLRLDPDATGRS
jgi:hypothetical protein